MKKLLLALLATALFSSAFAGQATKESSVITAANSIDKGVKVQWSESGTVALKMFNARGQVIKSFPRLSISAGSSTTLEVNGLAKGVYYITVNTGSDLQKIALVK